MSESPSLDATPPPWTLDLAVAAWLVLPSGERLDRDAFLGWLWDRFGAEGLTGITEGEVGVAEAAAAGLVPSPVVLDAAASPADRDWVAALAGPTVTVWIAGEAAARAVAGDLAGVEGCRVAEIRPAPATADWRLAFVPVDVPGFGVIQPAWEPGIASMTAGRTTMFIDPGIGFGTGLHPTTRLCLAALATWQESGGRIARVLDVGAGSGILGIAAAVRGAARVDAIEIDVSVHPAIRANAARNGVADRIGVLQLLEHVADDGHDLVFANIVAPVLLGHAASLANRLRRGPDRSGHACLVLSGLLAADVGPVMNRYTCELGAAPVVTCEGDWHCLRYVVLADPHQGGGSRRMSLES